MTEHDEKLKELRDLLGRMCDGELSAAGYLRIEQLVRGDADARQLYIDYLLLQGELHWAGGRTSTPAPALFESEFAAGIGDELARDLRAVHSQAESVGDRRELTRSSSERRAAPAAVPSRRWPLIGAAVAAGLLLAATIHFQRGKQTTERVASAQDVIAELRSADGCTWAGARPKLAAGSTFHAGEKLELTAGVARFWFAKGTTLLVESPAEFELISSTSVRLVRGSVAARANGPVKDFVVISPDASIVDLGTSFAVHCDKDVPTQVEVLEGSVEVFPDRDPKNGHVVEMGANVSIGGAGDEVALIATHPDEYRFAALIEQLWADIRTDATAKGALSNGEKVEADFSDLPGASAVDTYYEAKPGDGWLTPWVAAGNPIGKILNDDSSFGLGNPYLRMKFNQSYERVIAREYGSRNGFDPSQPHVITWRWRLEGDFDQFGKNFHDRVTFYGNPFFRRNSWPTNSWLIGAAGGDEPQGGRGQSSTSWLRRKYKVAATDVDTEALRRVYPKHWYFFDSKSDDVRGCLFDRSNMVDTGMKLKPGVIYRFAIAVYPGEARYDAAIRDDKQTVVRTGLTFRNRDRVPANVLHFAVNADQPNEDLAFSLDSVQIQPLAAGTLRQQLEAVGDRDREETQ